MIKKNQALEHTCVKCDSKIKYLRKDTYFDETGYGYSTRLLTCPYCNTPNVLRYYEDRAMKLNRDSRFYNYKKESFLKGEK